MHKFTSFIITLSFFYSFRLSAAQLPNRAVNCSKSLSKEYSQLFTNRQEFESTIYSTREANLKEQNALNRALLLNLPARFYERLFLETTFSL